MVWEMVKLLNKVVSDIAFRMGAYSFVVVVDIATLVYFDKLEHFVEQKVFVVADIKVVVVVEFEVVVNK